jgi:hypothetical protein
MHPKKKIKTENEQHKFVFAYNQKCISLMAKSKNRLHRYRHVRLIAALVCDSFRAAPSTFGRQMFSGTPKKQ